jgi:prepilin-type N-terminal cleavage/methylation domain-containing protein
MMQFEGGDSARFISIVGYKRRCTGFSLFELIVGIVIVGVLGTYLSERMLRYQEYAEKTAMEVTARRLQTALRLQVADLMMRDRLHEIDRLLQEDPMTWLEAPPANYVGQRNAMTQEDALKGKWHYDAAQRAVIYIPFHHRFFKPLRQGDNTISYRIVAIPVTSGGGSRRIEGLSLSLATPYQWEIPLRWDEI